jgi:predicted anti-sigma-YlaC factor YlaD
MNSHLSLEEIHQWLSGERRDEVEEHFRECPACKAELHQLQSALAGFRSSLEQSPIPPVSYLPVRRTLPRWILATAALALLVATPVYWNVRQQRAAEQTKADEVLLERVNAGLSRSVPASMEPLMQLISKEEK